MKQHGGLLNRHGVGLKYNTSRDIVFCKGRYSYSRYQGYLRSMLITITVAVSEYSQSLYLKYERTGAHFFFLRIFVYCYDIQCGGSRNFKTEVRSWRGRIVGPGFVLMSLHTHSMILF